MKLRIAEMGDGMFEVQEEGFNYQDRCPDWFPIGRYDTLEGAQRRLQAMQKTYDDKSAARTVVRVWEQ